MFLIFHYLRLHIYFLVHIAKTLTVLRVGILGAAHGLGLVVGQIDPPP